MTIKDNHVIAGAVGFLRSLHAEGKASEVLFTCETPPSPPDLTLPALFAETAQRRLNFLVSAAPTVRALTPEQKEAFDRLIVFFDARLREEEARFSVTYGPGVARAISEFPDAYDSVAAPAFTHEFGLALLVPHAVFASRAPAFFSSDVPGDFPTNSAALAAQGRRAVLSAYFARLDLLHQTGALEILRGDSSSALFTSSSSGPDYSKHPAHKMAPPLQDARRRAQRAIQEAARFDASSWKDACKNIRMAAGAIEHLYGPDDVCAVFSYGVLATDTISEGDLKAPLVAAADFLLSIPEPSQEGKLPATACNDLGIRILSHFCKGQASLDNEVRDLLQFGREPTFAVGWTGNDPVIQSRRPAPESVAMFSAAISAFSIPEAARESLSAFMADHDPASLIQALEAAPELTPLTTSLITPLGTPLFNQVIKPRIKDGKVSRDAQGKVLFDLFPVPALVPTPMYPAARHAVHAAYCENVLKNIPPAESPRVIFSRMAVPETVLIDSASVPFPDQMEARHVAVDCLMERALASGRPLTINPDTFTTDEVGPLAMRLQGLGYTVSADPTGPDVCRALLHLPGIEAMGAAPTEGASPPSIPLANG